MNTKIEYMYRDASNWKQYDECIVSGSMTESEITPFLHDGEFFIPGELGLKNLCPDVFGEDDHVWHEICSVEPTEEPATVPFDTKELLRRLRKAASVDWNEYEWERERYGNITGMILEERTT